MKTSCLLIFLLPNLLLAQPSLQSVRDSVVSRIKAHKMVSYHAYLRSECINSDEILNINGFCRMVRDTSESVFGKNFLIFELNICNGRYSLNFRNLSTYDFSKLDLILKKDSKFIESYIKTGIKWDLFLKPDSIHWILADKMVCIGEEMIQGRLCWLYRQSITQNDKTNIRKCWVEQKNYIPLKTIWRTEEPNRWSESEFGLSDYSFAEFNTDSIHYVRERVEQDSLNRLASRQSLQKLLNDLKESQFGPTNYEFNEFIIDSINSKKSDHLFNNSMIDPSQRLDFESLSDLNDFFNFNLPKVDYVFFDDFIAGFDIKNLLKWKKIGVNGKVTIVHFWYSNCLDCIRATRQLNLLRDSFPENQVAIVGLNPKESPEKKHKNLNRIIENKEIRYDALLIDPDYIKRYQLDSWPLIYVLDKKGRVIYRLPGFSVEMNDVLSRIIRKELE